MDLSTVISSTLGVILGAVITWITAWYYARKSAKDMERIIAEAMGQLNKTIPRGAADQVVSKNLTNTVLAMMPFIISGLAKLSAGGDEDSGDEDNSGGITESVPEPPPPKSP